MEVSGLPFLGVTVGRGSIYRENQEVRVRGVDRQGNFSPRDCGADTRSGNKVLYPGARQDRSAGRASVQLSEGLVAGGEATVVPRMAAQALPCADRRRMGSAQVPGPSSPSHVGQGDHSLGGEEC